MSKPLIRLLLRSFGALSRLALKHGLKIQEVQELLKRGFIEGARFELESLGAKANTSKIAAMTGLQRRDVERLLSLDEIEDVSAQNSLLIRLLGHWQSVKPFVEPSGKAKRLPMDGTKSSFVSLVQAVSGDLNPYTILFELERLSLVQRSDEGIRLLKEGVEVDRDVARGFDLLGQDIKVLVQAVDQNLTQRANVPNLHITTSYDNIDPAHIPKLREWVLEKGAGFHRELRAYLSKFDRDGSSKYQGNAKTKAGDKSSAKVIVGTFSLTEER